MSCWASTVNPFTPPSTALNASHQQQGLGDAEGGQSSVEALVQQAVKIVFNSSSLQHSTAQAQ